MFLQTLHSLVVIRLKQFSPSVNASLENHWKHIIHLSIYSFYFLLGTGKLLIVIAVFPFKKPMLNKWQIRQFNVSVTIQINFSFILKFKRKKKIGNQGTIAGILFSKLFFYTQKT